MQPPDLETRVAILKKKAQIENLRVPDELFIYIASKIKSNIRELEGALNRIIAFSELVKQDITIDLAEEALKDILDEKTNKIITARIIQENVATHFNIRLDDFKSKRRTKNISYPRQIAMYLCRDMTELSLPKIGEAFGGRDHTTVLHAVSKIEGDISRDSEIKNAVTQIIKNIKEK
jgi:chromosomal replication initiator protein